MEREKPFDNWFEFGIWEFEMQCVEFICVSSNLYVDMAEIVNLQL
jgi:hypothetical protein